VLPKLIEIIVELGAQATVTVEDIENEKQQRIAVDSGATLLQGYQLGRPATVSVWRELATVVASVTA
jgi:EAL domain-containing protein (putative c-di-GMP-specific phosphodiesterase class I)